MNLALRIQLAAAIIKADGHQVNHLSLTLEDWPETLPRMDVRYAAKASRSVLWARGKDKLIPYPLPQEKA